MKTKRTLAVLLSLMMLFSCLSISSFAASSATITVEASATDAVTGDTVTYTVYMVDCVDVWNYEFTLEIPEGLTYVAGSAAYDANFATTTGFMVPDFNEEYMFASAMGALAAGYTGEKVAVMTFKCTVDGDVGGALAIDVTGALLTTATGAAVEGAVDTAASAVTVPCPHDWDNGVVTTEPGCETVGTKTFTCALCQETKTEDVPAVGHTYGDAACDAPATCTVCGASTGEALGHSFTNYVSNGDATCTADGTKTAKCDRCDATDTIADEGSALGHSFSDAVVTKEPTCTEPGEKTGTCSVCGETTSEEIPALGHSWDEGEVTTEPTCVAKGVKTYTCTACGETKTESIKALGHKYVDDVCSVCGQKKPSATITPNNPEEDETVADELTFTDVNKDDWFYNDVVYAYEMGLMNGTGANKFSPAMTTDRAMLVTVLWRLEGSPVVDGTIEFTDVADGMWYTAAIDWASAKGIVNGYDTGKFGPADQITREQIMAILNRYAIYKGYTSDAAVSMVAQYNCSDWAENNVNWAALNGLLADLGVDVTDMTAAASRAELAAYLHRFMVSIVK